MAASRTVDAGSRGAFAALVFPAAWRLQRADRLRSGSQPRRRQLHQPPRRRDPAWPADLPPVGVVPGRGEQGPDHQVPAPVVTPPEELPDLTAMVRQRLPEMPEQARRFWERDRPFEFRSVERGGGRQAAARRAPPLVPAGGSLPRDDAVLHRCLLAYVSDFHLLETATLAARAVVPHGRRAARQPRPRHVVSPSVPHRRLAALRADQPEQQRRARHGLRAHLRPRRAGSWPAPRRKA